MCEQHQKSEMVRQMVEVLRVNQALVSASTFMWNFNIMPVGMLVLMQAMGTEPFLYIFLLFSKNPIIFENADASLYAKCEGA